MSTQVQINDVPPKTQITATAGQTVFTTNWTANAASDVVVYARTSAQEPDDLTQLVSNVDYTVAFIGGSEIVEVTFLVARAANDVITITRDTPADRLNLYTNNNFTPSMLNQDVGILTLVDQQAQLYNTQVAPHYNVSATPDLGDPISGEGGDIYLPTLGANQFWVKNAGNTEIIATDLPSGGGQLPVALPLVTYTNTPYLTAEANLGALSTGVLYQTVAAGVATLLSKSTTGTGDVVLDNSPTITTPSIDQINDANGNANLLIHATASAVNYMISTNSATGGFTGFEVAGSDTNAKAFIKAKGDAGVAVITSAVSAVPFAIYSGTAQQHVTTFSFSNTNATRAVTFQDADGTVAYLSDITGAAGWVLISTGTANNSTSIDFTGLSTTYSAYKIVYYNVYPANNSTTLLYRVSTDNGSTFETTAYMYSGMAQSTGSYVAVSSTSDGSVPITAGGGMTNLGVQYTSSGEVTIFNPAGTQQPHAMLWSTSYRSPTARNPVFSTGQGYWNSSTAVNAIRFLFDSGNITGGTFKLYGILA